MLIEMLLVTKTINLLTNYAILRDYDMVILIGVIICFPLAFFNYYIFIIKKNWKQYVAEFESMKAKNKWFANIGVVCFFGIFIWFVFI